MGETFLSHYCTLQSTALFGITIRCMYCFYYFLKKLTNEYKQRRNSMGRGPQLLELQACLASPALAVSLPATHSRAGRFSKWKRWVPPPSSTAGQPARFPAHGLPFSPTQREAGKRPREENTEPAQNWPLPSEQRGESVAFLKPPGFQGLLGPQIRPHLSLPLSPLGEHLPVPGGKRQQPLCPHSFSEHRQTDMYAILHLGHRSPHRNLC